MKGNNAAAILIGDEILNGEIQDLNTKTITKFCKENGLKLHKITFIRDEAEEIKQAAKEFNTKYDYVFLSGGIGPTHDDITVQSITDAFNLKLEIQKDIIEEMKKEFKREPNKYELKMAFLPKTAKRITNTISKIPGFNIENLYVMAGVPVIFENMIQSLKQEILNECNFKEEYSEKIEIDINESLIAADIEKLSNKYKNLKIGIYPQSKTKTIIIIRSEDKNDVQNIKRDIKKISYN